MGQFGNSVQVLCDRRRPRFQLPSGMSDAEFNMTNPLDDLQVAMATSIPTFPIGSAIAHAPAGRCNPRANASKSLACSDRVHLSRCSSGITMGLSTRSPCFGQGGRFGSSRPIIWTLSATSV